MARRSTELLHSWVLVAKNLCQTVAGLIHYGQMPEWLAAVARHEPALTADELADGAAQMIAYRALAARLCSHTSKGHPSALQTTCPRLNAWLMLGRDASVPGFCFAAKPMAGEQTDRLYLYERFLAAYHSQKRRQRGVFYTPVELADFIVRGIDEILQRQFGLRDGLADTSTWGDMAARHPAVVIPQGIDRQAPFVRILDPAVGTGAFLIAAVRHIHRRLEEKWRKEGRSPVEIRGLWNEYVPEDLLGRLFGLELMPVPAAVALEELADELAATGYEFTGKETVHLALGNSLEEPVPGRPAVDWPMTVVLGNPPYRGLSATKNAWIEGLLRQPLRRGEVPGYYEVDGQPLAERKVWLQDDYVKFLRYGQSRIEQSGCGVMGYVTNHSFLDNPTFRGLRRSLMRTFSEMRLVDLQGSAKRGPRTGGDENIFEIAQGVAVGLFSRPPDARGEQVYHGQIWGSRETKLAALAGDACQLGAAAISPVAPFYFFVPSAPPAPPEYEAAWPLPRAMPQYVSGAVTARDAIVFGWNPEELLARIGQFRDPALSDDDLRNRYFVGKGSPRYPPGDSRGWKLPVARRQLAERADWERFVTPCLYRPFDIRPLYYAPFMVDWPRTDLMQHLVAGDNLALVTARQQSQQGCTWRLVTVSRQVTESCAISNKTREINYVFPLHVAADSNFAADFVDEIAARIGLNYLPARCGNLQSDFGPVDLFHYCFGLLCDPAYRLRYAAYLQRDFPRIVLPEGRDEFARRVLEGADLAAFHLLDERYPAASWNGGGVGNPFACAEVSWEGSGDWTIGAGFPRYAPGLVAIHDARGCRGVSQRAWECWIGSYQPAKKWLKDRRGRALTLAEAEHYRRMVIALDAIARMTEGEMA